MGLGIQSLFTLNYVKYHLTQESRDAYYLRNIGSYNLVQWINKNLGTSDRIANPIRYLNYLFEVPYFYLRSSSQNLINYPHSLDNIDKIIKQLNTENINHIIDWHEVTKILVKKKIYKVLISFDTVALSSRTLGISEKSKSRIIRINNEIK